MKNHPRAGCFSALLASFLLLAASLAHAAGSVTAVPTREGVTNPVFWEAAPQASATVLLLPGGSGGFGKVEAGRALGQNFLVRSEPYFIANGLNVAILGRASDAKDMDLAERTGEAHLADVRRVVEHLKTLSDAPVWLVGTSRGTVSAAAAAIALQDAVAGVVLTSSVVAPRKPGAVQNLALDRIRVPVLVLHHARDACPLCQPQDVPAILAGLQNAPVRKQVLVDGGANPSGPVCDALNWHGYIGMEREAVDLIAGWIRNPRE